MGKREQERETNDQVAAAAQAVGGSFRGPSRAGWMSAVAPPGIMVARRRLAPILGLSVQSLWRFASAGAPAWLLFALLGVAVSKGDRERARQLLEAASSEQ